MILITLTVIYYFKPNKICIVSIVMGFSQAEIFTHSSSTEPAEQLLRGRTLLKINPGKCVNVGLN